MIKNIIFDVGEVLTMHVKGKEWSDALLAKESGMPLSTVKAFFAEYAEVGSKVHGMSLGEFWEKKTVDTGAMTLGTAKRASVRYRENIVLNQEMIEILRALKPRYRLFALTNVWKPGHTFRDQLATYFEAFVQSCDISMRKPARAIFRHMLATYNLKPEETLFVDNRLENVAAARAAGIAAFQFTTVSEFKLRLRLYLA